MIMDLTKMFNVTLSQPTEAGTVNTVTLGVGTSLHIGVDPAANAGDKAVVLSAGSNALGLSIGVSAELPAAEAPAIAPDELAADAAAKLAGCDTSPIGSSEVLAQHQQLSKYGSSFSPGKAREMGLYFGYPRCCVEEFVTKVEEGLLPGSGASYPGGFIPCAKCAGVLSANGKDNSSLITNRVAPTKFPHSNFDEDMKVLMRGRPSATMIKILRLSMKLDSTSPVEPATTLKWEDQISRMPKVAYENAMEYLRTVKE